MALPPSWSTPHYPDQPSRPTATPQPTDSPSTFSSNNPTGVSYTTQLSPHTSLRLNGDKILLPQGTLEALISSATAAATAAAARRGANPNVESWEGWRNEVESGGMERAPDSLLPHPITFRLYNPANNRYTHAVPREFSAGEGEVVLSPFLAEVLGLNSSLSPSSSLNGSPPSGSVSPLPMHSRSPSPPASEAVEAPKLTLIFKPLPKGKYVRLRPLEAGYAEEDWKALLERELRLGYSTLTVGEVLSVGKLGAGITRDTTGAARERYRFLIDKLLPEGSDGVTVVDTDMEVDIEPLSEEQARETLKKRLAAKREQGGKRRGGKLVVGEIVEGNVAPGEYLDFKLEKWDREKGVTVELIVGEGAGGDEEVGSQVDLLVSTSRYCADGGEPGVRSGPREDEYVWGNLGSNAVKRVVIGKGNVEIVPVSGEAGEGNGEGPEGVEWLGVTVHGYLPPSADSEEETPFRLRVSQDGYEEGDAEMTNGTAAAPDADTKICTNCHQAIPTRTYALHTAFCFRNNVICNHVPSCGQVFRKGTMEGRHWHCPKPECAGTVHGNDKTSGGLEKHLRLFHTPRECAGIANTDSASITCGFVGLSTPAVAHHRVTTCPAKRVLCRFCHLRVPQESFFEDGGDAIEGDLVGEQRYLQHMLNGLSKHEVDCGARTTDCDLCGRPVKLLDLGAHMKHHDMERRARPAPVVCRNENCARTAGVDGNDMGLCGICFGPLYASGYDPQGANLKRRFERKLLTQGVTGCGRRYCTNRWCKTGRLNLGMERAVRTMAEVKKEVAGVVEGLRDKNLPVGLCVDEATQKRRALAEGMCAAGGYEVAWGVKAVEEAGGDEAGARKWLARWGVRRDEVGK
ncbi:hypothetical protein BDZ91DRAFT_696719 [Kalaharituber pfeilii]|nr:hypothetical protein BDZ91DRAFT_696719 [Kalaharituber pfeilii]